MFYFFATLFTKARQQVSQQNKENVITQVVSDSLVFKKNLAFPLTRYICPMLFKTILKMLQQEVDSNGI